jgi:hypothetical protein
MGEMMLGDPVAKREGSVVFNYRGVLQGPRTTFTVEVKAGRRCLVIEQDGNRVELGRVECNRCKSMFETLMPVKQ